MKISYINTQIEWKAERPTTYTHRNLSRESHI